MKHPSLLQTSLNHITNTAGTFYGWAITADGPLSYVDEATFTMGPENITLYALWAFIDRDWGSIASSADGTKLVAAVGGPGGHIYTSTNSGVTWTPHF